jgi:hypothetical protein
MAIRNELIDDLLAGQDPASIMRQYGLLRAEEGVAGRRQQRRSGSTRTQPHASPTIRREFPATTAPPGTARPQHQRPDHPLTTHRISP